jgi:hypothetical protein
MFDMLFVDYLLMSNGEASCCAYRANKPSVGRMMSAPSVQKAEHKKEWTLI